MCLPAIGNLLLNTCIFLRVIGNLMTLCTFCIACSVSLHCRSCENGSVDATPFPVLSTWSFIEGATFFVMSGKTFLYLDYLQYCLVHLHYLGFFNIQFLIFQKVGRLFFHIWFLSFVACLLLPSLSAVNGLLLVFVSLFSSPSQFSISQQLIYICGLCFSFCSNKTSFCPLHLHSHQSGTG